MLVLDDYAKIRHAYFSQKKSIREISRELGFCWKTVRQAIDQAEPQTSKRSHNAPPPKLTVILQKQIEEILQQDQKAPRKQRHTAAQIFRRLQDEHDYQGGYDQVRRYVAAWRKEQRETFVPLSHSAGRRMEADFGQIYVDFPQGRRPVSVLMLTWAYSDCPFAIALPTQRTEAILQGMVEGFLFFGCVPHEVWWDNPKTVAKTILGGRQRELHPRYQALASHYCFDPCFCMPRRGQEKPRVENRVKQLQRRWATPVPQVENHLQLNQMLIRLCQADLDRIVAGQSQTIGQRFAQEQAAALSLPAHPFDPCVIEVAGVDKYQTVAFDNNRYSVPRSHAFQTITLKGYVDRVELVDQAQLLARHQRCYDHGERILNPLHYLVTLGRKPACLDHSEVYRNWRLPACFGTFRQALEQRQGKDQGARQYIRVLQLLADHPLARVQQALESVPAERPPSAERIIRLVQTLQQQAQQAGGSAVSTTFSDHAARSVCVPPPDLRMFDQLLSHDSTATVEANLAGEESSVVCHGLDSVSHSIGESMN